MKPPSPYRYYITHMRVGTPFTGSQDDTAFLATHGFERSGSRLGADLIISSRPRRLIRAGLPFGPSKRYLLWTDEPGDAPYSDPTVRLLPGWIRAHAMTVFTGDVFVDNYYFFGNLGLLPENTRTWPADEPLKRWSQARTAAVVTCRLPQRVSQPVGGLELDHEARRVEIAARGHQLGVTDIYGGGWPEGMAKSESGWQPDGGGWHWFDIKREILASYAYNLCFENTHHRDYVTEKIWHAIQGGCLPIYHGLGTRVYDDFPPDSFIEAGSFKDAHSLYCYLAKLPYPEYERRWRICQQVFLDAMARFVSQRTERLSCNRGRLLARLEQIAGRTG